MVENNVRHAAAITADLNADGIKVEVAGNGEDAFYVMRDYEFDLVLLNQRLPDIDGNTLISRIRSAKYHTPIIALAAASQLSLHALAAGADDVVEIEMDRVELIARIRAVVRRSRGFSKSFLRVGDLTLDVNQHDVTANGVRAPFTPREFAILELLVLRRNVIMTKEVILTHLYGGIDEPEIKIIDVFICKIRNKLAKVGLPVVISTAWGRGYTVKDTTPDAPHIPPRPQPAQMERVFA